MIYSLEELLPVVIKISEKYTGKESTSLTYEAADRLMGAVIYCIEEYEKEWGKDEGEPEEVRLSAGEERLSAEDAYARGYQAVIRKVWRSKALYEEIIGDFKWYGNRALYETISKGMPAFFLGYDARFHPQDHLLTLDYPILRSLHELCGVDAIWEYLNCIRLEQKFLSGFSKEVVVSILTQFHADYKSLFLNLASVVMNGVIKNMADTESYAADHAEEEVTERLRHGLALLMRERYDNDQELLDYLLRDVCYRK